MRIPIGADWIAVASWANIPLLCCIRHKFEDITDFPTLRSGRTYYECSRCGAKKGVRQDGCKLLLSYQKLLGSFQNTEGRRISFRETVNGNTAALDRIMALMLLNQTLEEITEGGNDNVGNHGVERHSGSQGAIHGDIQQERIQE